MLTHLVSCNNSPRLDRFASSGQAVTPISEDMLNPTYASERPSCTQLYSEHNLSLFSTYARQLTTQHHLLSQTWLFGFVRMCQNPVRRPPAQHQPTNQLAEDARVALQFPGATQAYLSITMHRCDRHVLRDDPTQSARGRCRGTLLNDRAAL